VDLLIFDAYAPEYDGWSVLQAAKVELPARYCLALVGSPHQIADVLAAGADGALLTGFSAAEFLQKLTELFPQEE
jgi:DNA-binding NarL/FixJ family response regulator